MQQITVPSLSRSFPLDEGKLFINGEWREANGGKRTPVINPATEEVVTTIAEADAADTTDAIRAAKAAFENGWAGMAPSNRAAILFRIADLIEKNAEELAFCEASEMGMLYRDSLYINIPHLISMFRYYAGWVTKSEGKTKPVEGWEGEHLFCYTRREPLGVIAGITPFNFPLVLSVSKIAPALATGNTFVHKPASGAPLSAIRLARIIEEAGIPKGVFNLVTGPGRVTGNTLTLDPDVHKIAITGSTQTGIQTIKNGADTLKHVTVELGGKSPLIVFEDADIDQAVDTAFFALFWNKGEVCVAGSRLLVQQSIFDQFIQKLSAKAESTVVGDPFDSNSFYGPMSSREALEKVMSYIEAGKKEGAGLVAGGEHFTINGKGFFIRPTIFAGNNQMRIAREEIFGPVLTVIPFADFDEAIRLANDSPYGLASGVQTKDLRKAIKAAELLKAGMVWLNTWHHYSPAAPFGGYKQSGYGRENGEEVLDYYTQIKSVWMDLNK